MLVVTRNIADKASLFPTKNEFRTVPYPQKITNLRSNSMKNQHKGVVVVTY